MGTAASRNVEGRNGGTGIATADPDDDDAGCGIRGLHHRLHHPWPQPHRQGPHTAKGQPMMSRDAPDFLDTALVESLAARDPDSGDATQHVARVLDHYLGRARAAPATSTTSAQGKLTQENISALKSLQLHSDVLPVSIPTKNGAHGVAPTASVGSLISDGGSVSSRDSVLTPSSLGYLSDGRLRRTLSPPADANSGASPPHSAEQSPTEQSPAEQSPTEQSPAEQSPAEQSPAEQSSAEQSPPPTPEHEPAAPLSTAWLNSIIRRTCVAGLEPRRSSEFVLDPAEIKILCRAAAEVFLSQPVLLELGTPVKIVGDVHGQFKDLMRIFRKCGMPPKTNYLFLGDYVDRGKQSLETIMLLMALKLRYPRKMFLLRGNHECANITKVYGFYDECKRRSTLKVWRQVIDVFNTLPIAATVGGKLFCIHGGLSPHLKSLDDISKVSRPTDVPDTGLVSDLLWSDPDPQVAEWAENDRGVSFFFGRRILDKFCRDFKFDLVVRGHMVVEDGYEFFGNRRLVTVFSAPNYCGDFDNWGAVMNVERDLTCSFELIEPLSHRKKTSRT